MGDVLYFKVTTTFSFASFDISRSFGHVVVILVYHKAQRCFELFSLCSSSLLLALRFICKEAPESSLLCVFLSAFSIKRSPTR